MQYMSLLQVDDVIVQETGASDRKIWRLGIMNSDGSVENELTLRLHGILSKAELTPGNLSKVDASKAATMTQRIELVGFGSSVFDDAVNNMGILHGLFGRFFGENRMLPLNLAPGTSTEVPFGAGVDPLGQLANFRRSGLIHTTENKVSYFKAVPDESTSERETVIYEAFPGTFRRGDLVEIEGVVIALANKHGKIKTTFQLSAMTLIDSSFSKAAEIARAKAVAPVQPQVVLKRKLWHESEDQAVVKARRQLRELALEDKEVAK
ncbi:hypothetical protein R3P38DRAFT_3189735 [Favolaschia claudopus]|uniref:Uncharacterized protein n=1 Tax=Favolaschia claudopus TaxID=2862362 RepID=A0AAW0BNU0_9AGAR